MALRKPKAERRAEILDAAIALADAEGLAAVTMRAVGQRVGVTAMALYGYFPGKDSLLDAMAEQVISEVPDSLSALPGWRDRLLALAGLAREMAREHPSVIQYLFSTPAQTPRTLRALDFIYQALLDAGVPGAEIPRLERFVSTFIMGWALSEVNGRFTTSGQFAVSRMSRRERRELLGPDELPAYDQLAAVRDAPTDWDAEFLADFTGILSLIEVAASASLSLPSPS